jgi:hypothetical protein
MTMRLVNLVTYGSLLLQQGAYHLLRSSIKFDGREMAPPEGFALGKGRSTFTRENSG